MGNCSCFSERSPAFECRLVCLVLIQVTKGTHHPSKACPLPWEGSSTFLVLNEVPLNVTQRWMKSNSNLFGLGGYFWSQNATKALQGFSVSCFADQCLPMSWGKNNTVAGRDWNTNVDTRQGKLFSGENWWRQRKKQNCGKLVSFNHHPFEHIWMQGLHADCLCL